ncbi:asparaginase [Yimella sp. cx-573]|nr:asparaginase [Yimella sp. cx-573]
MSRHEQALIDAPVVAVVERSGFVESVHRGIVVAVDAGGELLVERGDVGAPCFPRSSNKPLQTLAMVRAGLDLPGDLMALASASHSGEQFHLDGVRRILAAAGLTVADLQNTPDFPYDDQSKREWLAAGNAASSIAQNCSGKHAAMLATCAVNGWDITSYRDPSHPLQIAMADTLGELCGEDVAATGVDGCGAPVMAVSPLGLARAFGRLAVAKDGPEHRVAEAIREHPEFLGGTRRDVTDLIRSIPGLVAKDGAEAVYAIGLPDGRGVVVKIADGGQRARPVVAAATLRQLGVAGDVLDRLADAPVLGHGEPVGSIRAV